MHYAFWKVTPFGRFAAHGYPENAIRRQFADAKLKVDDIGFPTRFKLGTDRIIDLFLEEKALAKYIESRDYLVLHQQILNGPILYRCC